MRFLRTNTATIVTVGPFLDKTDGVTIETGLTITNEKISLTVDLNDGSAPTLVLDNVTGATSGTANDLNYITNCNAGLMQLELAAANVNYVGRAFLTITDAANHCPVFHEFMILPANVYDSLILGSGTDLLDVSAVQLAGTALTGRDIGASVLLSAGTGTGQLDFTSGVVKANLVQILASTISGTAAQISAAFTKFFDKASPTGTINSLPDAVPDAAGGLPVTGTRLTAIPWSAAWDAEVQSEAQDAITASGLATAAELAKVPKSDSNVSWNATALAAINAEVDTALNTAIPGSPTANSINQRIAAIDDLTQASGAGDLAAILTDTGTTLDTLIKDLPTVAEFEARTILAADYTVVSDLPSVPSAADIKTAIEADGSKLDHLWEMTEDDGGVRRLTTNALEQAPTGGSAPTAAAIRAEIDANSTQLAAILTDTGTTLPGTLATIAGYIDTEVAATLAAVDTEVAAIKAKTDNLPASPAATGAAMTLTAAYDAAKSAASQTSVNDLPTNSELATALAGADDAVLTAIADLPTVAEFEARTIAAADYTIVSDLPTVPSAADNATAVAAAILATPANKLDTDASGYVSISGTKTTLDALNDAPDMSADVGSIKGTTDKLDTALELDGAVYRYTTNALEQSPAGSGGGLTAQQVRDAMKLAPTAGTPDAGSVDAHLDDILTDTGTTLDTLIKDIPTNAEFEARTLPSADYTVVGDLPSVPSAADVADAVLDEAKGAHTGHLASIPTNPYTGTPPTASDNATAVAAAILVTPANKLETDASGHVSISGTKNTLDSLSGADGDTLKDLSDEIAAIAVGAGLTAQEVRDAMKLAPTAGAPAAGSVDEHLDDILEDTGTTLPASIAALNNLSISQAQAAATAALNAYDPPTKAELDAADDAVLAVLTAIKGAGWTDETLVALDVLLDAIKAKTDLLTAGNITMVSPVTVSGDVTIDQGYDYYTADGRGLSWTDETSATWPDLSGATATLRVGGLAITGAITNPTGPATITVELSRLQTASLAVGVHRFKIDVTLANTHLILQIRGDMIVS